MCEQYSKRSTSIVFFCVVSRSKHWPDWSTIVVRPQATRCPCVWPDTWHKHFACPAAHISLSLSPSLPYSLFRAWDLVSHAATATVACLFNWLSALGTAQAQLHPPESAHDFMLFARSNCQPAISHCLRRLLIMTDNASSVGNNNGARALISSVGGYLLVSLESLLINTK